MKIDKCDKCGTKGNVNSLVAGKTSSLLCVKCQVRWYDYRDEMIADSFKKWVKNADL
jgi:hypothetical protein